MIRNAQSIPDANTRFIGEQPRCRWLLSYGLAGVGDRDRVGRDEICLRDWFVSRFEIKCHALVSVHWWWAAA
jgi:hypothetical protein